MPSLVARSLFASALLAVASPLHAQALSGLVRLAPAGTGAGQTVVLAVAAGARIVASARTDSSGVFALHLGEPGTYHLVFVRARSEPVATPDFVLDSTAYVEREFRIPGDTTVHEAVYTAADVTTPATPHLRNPQPAYPDREARTGVRGRVRALFVVDSTGRVDERTVNVVGTTGETFAKAVRTSLRGARYTPARAGDRRVPQVVEQLYDFGCNDDPVNVPVGTIVIRTFYPTCSQAR